jgi:hypothetical protein
MPPPLWGWKFFWAIPRQKLTRIGDLVLNPLPRRLPLRPKLKILKPVIRPVAVLVMDRLIRPKRSTEAFLHHEPMLELQPAVARPLHVALAVHAPCRAARLSLARPWFTRNPVFLDALCMHDAIAMDRVPLPAAIDGASTPGGALTRRDIAVAASFVTLLRSSRTS